jgi:transcriptional regulator with XRE-family HTH domain
MNGVRITKLRARMLDFGGPDWVTAAHLGITASALSEYQMGKRIIPVRHLLALARLLQCDWRDIAGDDDEIICLDELSDASV